MTPRFVSSALREPQRRISFHRLPAHICVNLAALLPLLLLLLLLLLLHFRQAMVHLQELRCLLSLRALY